MARVVTYEIDGDAVYPRDEEHRFRIYARRGRGRTMELDVLACAGSPAALGLALVTLDEDEREHGRRLIDHGAIGVLDSVQRRWIVMPMASTRGGNAPPRPGGDPVRVRQYTKEQAAAFGLRLRTIREQAHLSQRELSFPGCTAAYISRVEKGERYPSVVLMRQLARRLGVTPEYLETGDGAPLSVDVLLARVHEAINDGLLSIAFRRGERPGVDVHFEYAGAEKIATGESLADALFGVATWAGRVAELNRLAEERAADSAIFDAELQRLLSEVVVNL